MPGVQTTNLDKLKLPQLKALCKEKGLAVGGNKPDLLQRLREKFSAEPAGGPKPFAKPNNVADNASNASADAAKGAYVSAGACMRARDCVHTCSQIRVDADSKGVAKPQHSAWAKGIYQLIHSSDFRVSAEEWKRRYPAGASISPRLAYRLYYCALRCSTEMINRDDVYRHDLPTESDHDFPTDTLTTCVADKTVPWRKAADRDSDALRRSKMPYSDEEWVQNMAVRGKVDRGSRPHLSARMGTNRCSLRWSLRGCAWATSSARGSRCARYLAYVIAHIITDGMTCGLHDGRELHTSMADSMARSMACGL